MYWTVSGGRNQSRSPAVGTDVLQNWYAAIPQASRPAPFTQGSQGETGVLLQNGGVYRTVSGADCYRLSAPDLMNRRFKFIKSSVQQNEGVYRTVSGADSCRRAVPGADSCRLSAPDLMNHRFKFIKSSGLQNRGVYPIRYGVHAVIFDIGILFCTAAWVLRFNQRRKTQRWDCAAAPGGLAANCYRAYHHDLLGH